MDDLHRNIKRCTYCTDDLSRRKAVVRGPKKNGMAPFFFKVHKIFHSFHRGRDDDDDGEDGDDIGPLMLLPR